MGVLGRVNYYGPWYENAVGAQTYGGSVLVDLETNYAVVEDVSVTIGVSNVLNVEPDNVTEAEPDDEDFTETSFRSKAQAFMLGAVGAQPIQTALAVFFLDIADKKWYTCIANSG